MKPGRWWFLGRALAAPFCVRELLWKPPSGTMRLASFGAAGMAFATLDGIASHPKVKLACVAEVDAERLDRVKKKYPDARIYQDWRGMLRKRRGPHNPAPALPPPPLYPPPPLPS